MQTLRDSFDFDQYFKNDQLDVDPAKVKPASHWVEDVVDRYHGETTKDSWKAIGFPKMRGLFDLRPGEMTIWAGVNGHGKTTLLSNVLLRVMDGGGKICLASLEMTPGSSMSKMVKQAAAVETPAVPYIRAFHQWTDDRLWIYDHVGKVAATRMLGVATYARKEMGVDHVVIDSLMKCGMGTDDYTAQKDFVDSLHSLARDTGVHIHLVVHMRKGENEYKPAGKFDVKGAGEITDIVDNLVIVWKDQSKRDKVEAAEQLKDLTARGAAMDELRKRPDAIVHIAKQRHFEFEGKFGFWFDAATQTFLDKPHWRPRWIDLQPILKDIA